jgi:hypothetical protein
MALKRLKNGQFQVKNVEEAREALIGSENLKEEIQALMQEHGIAEMMEDAAEMKKAATAWAANTDTPRIDLGNGRQGEPYALLRRDKYGGTWIASSDDIDANTPVSVIPLLFILRQKFKNKTERSEIWNRITKRTVDQGELDRVVREGLLTAEEIAPAFYEKEKAPFLIVYGKK